MTTLATQSAVDSKIYAVCDIMRRSNCASALQYIPELTWLLFLRALDEREELETEEAKAVGAPFQPSLEFPYRWRDWAAPGGAKREELQSGVLGATFAFVNGELLPTLHGLTGLSGATPRQRVVGQIMEAVESVRIDTEKNFLDVLDAVHQISVQATDPTHVFLLSQAYEGLLLRMGEKNNDGGQFFTPREVIRAMVRTVGPKLGETVYDPGCGTGGFLAQSYDWMKEQLGQSATATQMGRLATATFYGREKENLIYPIALANLALHGIDRPNIWHGNTLTRNESYGGLFQGAPDLFDVILMNPPFGGKEGSEAQTRYPYKTGSTQVLFLQEVIDSLKPGGRAGIVVDEGLLFRTNENAFVQTKRKAAGRVRPVVHSEPAQRGVHPGRGWRQDQPALLHQGEPHREGLVLRPVRREGHQAETSDPVPIRRVLPAAPRPSRQRAQLERLQKRPRVQELRPEGREPPPPGAGRHPHSTGSDRHHRGQGPGDRGRAGEPEEAAVRTAGYRPSPV